MPPGRPPLPGPLTGLVSCLHFLHFFCTTGAEVTMKRDGRVPTDLDPEQLEKVHRPGPIEPGRPTGLRRGCGAADFGGAAGPV